MDWRYLRTMMNRPDGLWWAKLWPSGDSPTGWMCSAESPVKFRPKRIRLMLQREADR